MFNYTEAVENTVNSRDTRGEILLYSYWSKLISLKKNEFYDDVLRELTVIFFKNIYLLYNIFKEATFYTSRKHKNAAGTSSMRCSKDLQSLRDLRKK